MQIDEDEAERPDGQDGRRIRRDGQRAAGGARRPARPVQGDGRRRADDRRPAERQDGPAPALRAGVAQRPGRQRLRRVRPARADLHALARSGDGARRRQQPDLHGRRLRSPDVDVPRPRQGAEGVRRRHRPRLARAQPCLFSGTERFFRAGYNANLEPSWIPALDGMAERLRAGARVADVGCGFGASTIVLAKAYPQVELRRLRLSRALDRRGARARAPRPASATG